MNSEKKKKTLHILTTGFVVFVIGNHFLKQDYYETFQSYNIIYIGFFVIISVVSYYIESLNSDKVLYAQESLLFWVSLGLLLFQVGIIPIFIFLNFLNFSGLYDYILLTLNFVLYGCMITGFIISKRAHN